MLTSFIVDNWYVGIPLVLGLMLLDALLTQVGYKFYLKYGKPYVELEHYELSPYWQKDVEEKGRIFSVRYILLLVIAGAGWGVIYAFGSGLIVEVFMGLYCGVFIPINLTHLNGLLFYYARSRIDGAVEGKLKYSYRFSTVSSAISNLTFGLLLSFLLLFTEASAFAVAFVAGPFIEALKALAWGSRKKKQAPAEDGKKKGKTIPWKRMVIGLVIVLIAFWALGTFVDDSYRDDYQKALEAYDKEDYETALEKFGELHRQSPDEQGALFNLALCYYHLSRFKEAKTLFELYVKWHGEGEKAKEAKAMAEQLYLQLKDEDE